MVTTRSLMAAENIALTRLVASPSLVTPGADAGADLPPLSARDDELVATAMRAPAVRFYEASLAVANANVKGRRAAYLPVLGANVSASWNNSDPTFDFGAGPKSSSYSYSFSASLPLFNGFSRENAITQARIQRDNAEARLNDFRMEVRQTVLTALENLRAAERRMAIQQSAAAMMETELRNSLRDYERGTRAFIDVLYAENALSEAQSRLIQARLDAKTARAQFEPLIAGGR